MSWTDIFWKAGTGGAAGALGPGGLLAGALLPMALGPLMGMGDQQRRMQHQAANYLSPEYIKSLSGTMFRDYTGGAGFAAAQRAAVGGANAFNRSLATNGSAFGNSGIGRLHGALGRSLVGNKMSSLYGSANMLAQQQAQQLAEAQARAVFAGGVPTNYTAQLGSAGINALLMRLLAPKQDTANQFDPNSAMRALMAALGMNR